MPAHSAFRGHRRGVGDWNQWQQELIIELDLHLETDEITHLGHMLKEYYE